MNSENAGIVRRSQLHSLRIRVADSTRTSTAAVLRGRNSFGPVLLALVFLVLLNGCGNAPGAPQAGISYVTISPSSLLLRAGATESFTGSAVGGNDDVIMWSVKEGSAGGTITTAGLYTAPATGGVYHVIATSRRDPAKSATATIQIATYGSPLTADLACGRSNHTATLLQDGKVLIAGGFSSPLGGGTVVSQAAIYDPAQHSFQFAGTIERALHTATLLADGDVLIAGGVIPENTPTASAELFKEASGATEPTGSMSSARSFQKAVLLKDGRVLIVGGSGGTELYDPAAGTFVPVADLLTGSDVTATLLQNGRVLITKEPSAEIFDPATNSFARSAGTLAKRFATTATLLPDGRVLIAGGETYYDFPYVGPAEIYDPATDQFTPTGQLLQPRWGHTATLMPDGTVLIAGGAVDADDTGKPWTEIYNSSTGSFTTGGSMLRGRVGHTATLLPDGTVLMLGGESGSNPIAEIFH